MTIAFDPGFVTHQWVAVERPPRRRVSALVGDRALTPSVDRYVVDVTPRRRGEQAAVYRRRRLAVATAALALLMVVIVGGLAAGRALAGRGGVPASAPAVQPIQQPAYVVQPGDSLWSIGERFHGDRTLAAYVEDLVQANGGADIDVGQRLVLPSP